MNENYDVTRCYSKSLFDNNFPGPANGKSPEMIRNLDRNLVKSGILRNQDFGSGCEKKQKV